jgi:hypothetical protein
VTTIFRTVLALFIVGCLAASIGANQRDRSVNAANQVTQTEPVSKVASNEPVSAVARTELPDGMSDLPPCCSSACAPSASPQR